MAVFTLCRRAAGFKLRKRQITNEPTGGPGNCPHLVEAVPCDEPSCYDWQLVSLDQCLPDDEKPCGPGTQLAQVQCVNSNGEWGESSPVVQIDHKISPDLMTSKFTDWFVKHILPVETLFVPACSSLEWVVLFAHLHFQWRSAGLPLCEKSHIFQGHLSTDPPAPAAQLRTWGDFHDSTPGCHSSTLWGVLSLQSSFLSPPC